MPQLARLSMDATDHWSLTPSPVNEKLRVVVRKKKLTWIRHADGTKKPHYSPVDLANLTKHNLNLRILQIGREGKEKNGYVTPLTVTNDFQ